MELSAFADVMDEESVVLLDGLETLAEVHCAFAQLMDIAIWQRDPEKLYTFMLELKSDSGAQPGSMREYVFDRLFSEGKIGELLDLPSQFNESLQLWLQNQVTCKAQTAIRSDSANLYFQDYIITLSVQ